MKKIKWLDSLYNENEEWVDMLMFVYIEDSGSGPLNIQYVESGPIFSFSRFDMKFSEPTWFEVLLEL